MDAIWFDDPLIFGDKLFSGAKNPLVSMRYILGCDGMKEYIGHLPIPKKNVVILMVTIASWGCKWMFPKIVGFPQIIHFNRVFHCKPIHFGVPLFLETPKCQCTSGFCFFTNAILVDPRVCNAMLDHCE